MQEATKTGGSRFRNSSEWVREGTAAADTIVSYQTMQDAGGVVRFPSVRGLVEHLARWSVISKRLS